jgi:hypothetical protein
MSIKYYPLGNLPISSSFAVTSSFSLNNEGGEGNLLTNNVNIAETSSFSIIPAPKGSPGRFEVKYATGSSLIPLDEEE